MRVFWDLVKIKIGELLIGYREKYRNSKFAGSFLTVSFILFMILFFLMLYVVASACCLVDHSEVLPTLNLLLCFVFCFTFSYFKVNYMLFFGSDYDLLLSMPIKRQYILYSRLLFLLCINFVASFCISLPIALCYFLYRGFQIMPFFLWLLIATTFAIVPVLCSSILHFFVYYFVKQLRLSRFIRVVAQLLVFFGCIITLYISIPMNQGSIKSNSSDLELLGDFLGQALEAYQKKYRFVELLKMSLLHQFGVNTILCFLFIVVLTFGYLQFVSKHFQWLHELFIDNTANSYKKNKDMKVRNQRESLVHKELHRIFTSEICMLNVVVPLLFLLIISVAFQFISPEEILKSLKVEEMFYDRNFSSASLNMSLMFAAMTLIGASNYAAVSVSLEGKNLWILLTMPISTKEIVKSKTMAHFIICIPFTFLSMILMVIKVEGSLVEKLLFVLLPIIYVVFCAMLGIFVNLRHVLLDWTSEVEVVKFSISSIISILGGAFLPIILSVMCQAITGVNYQMIEFVLFLILIVVSYLLYQLSIRKQLMEYISAVQKGGNENG